MGEYIRSSSLVCLPVCLGVCLSIQAWSGAEAIVSGPTGAVRGPASHHESPTVDKCHHDDAVHDCTSRLGCRQVAFFFASRLERSYSICTVLSYLLSPCEKSPSLSKFMWLLAVVSGIFLKVKSNFRINPGDWDGSRILLCWSKLKLYSFSHICTPMRHIIPGFSAVEI